MRKLVKQLRHGQITIPKDFRDALGIAQDDVLSVTLANGKLEIEPVNVQPKGTSSAWVKELYDLFAPVRERLTSYSEEEINEAIDEAVKAVRAARRKR